MKTNKSKMSYRGVAIVNFVRLAILACLLTTGFGLAQMWLYTNPMVNEKYNDASGGIMGDDNLILYARAVDAYERYRDTRYAKQILKAAFNNITSQTGAVPEDKRELASKIQHLIGVVNEDDKQFRLAIAAYEESLKANPNNMESKYNLERLKNQHPDLGKKKPDQPGGPKAGDDKKKGI